MRLWSEIKAKVLQWLTELSYATQNWVESKGYMKLQTDWRETDPGSDAYLVGKPSETNYNVYNNIDSIVINDTNKTSIIGDTPPTISTVQGTSYVGRVFGSLSGQTTSKDIKIYFSLGDQEAVQTISGVSGNTFYIDYVINFDDTDPNSIPSISAIMYVGSNVRSIKITSFLSRINQSYVFNMHSELQEGSMIIYSSYLHRNVN